LAGLPAWYRKLMSPAGLGIAAGFTVAGGGGVHHAWPLTRPVTRSPTRIRALRCGVGDVVRALADCSWRFGRRRR